MFWIYKILSLKRKRNPSLYIKNKLLEIFTKITNKKMGLFVNLCRSREFLKAIEIGNDLMHKNNGNSEFLKQYAICCFYSGNIERAKEIMSKVLVSETKCELETVIEHSSMIDGNFTISSSEYDCHGGYYNYGFVKNCLEDNDDVKRCIVSKIVSLKSEQINFEEYFYDNICKRYPELISIVPEFHGYHKIAGSKIALIRTGYIQKAIPKNKDIYEIIKINRIIESIPYVEDEMLFGDKRFIRDKYIQQSLHEEITNREAISEMNFFLNKIKDGEKLKSLVRRLEKTILKKQLYKKIKPKVHYSFCHNDFHRNNIIAEKGLGRFKVIDWNSYCVALRGWDMNCYFGYYEFKFDEIKEMYIDYSGLIFKTQNSDFLMNLIYVIN